MVRVAVPSYAVLAGVLLMTPDLCSAATSLIVSPAEYPPGGGVAVVRVSADWGELGGGAVQVVEGFCFGICHDPAAAQILSAKSLAGYEGESLEWIKVYPDGVGYSWSVNLCSIPEGCLPWRFLEITYLVHGKTDVTPCDTLGTRPFECIYVMEGQGYPFDTVVGSSLISEPTPFVRGDPNSDSQVNIADAIWVLFELFYDGPVAPCQDASDANDSGEVDIADVVFLLNYLFALGAPPESPFPSCGDDPSADELPMCRDPACE
jgi:hypothetical protein